MRPSLGPGPIYRSRLWMVIGLPRPLPRCPMRPALYPIPVRRVRVWGCSYLQIPTHDGHPGLPQRFRPSWPAMGFHRQHASHAWPTKRRRHRFASSFSDSVERPRPCLMSRTTITSVPEPRASACAALRKPAPRSSARPPRA